MDAKYNLAEANSLLTLVQTIAQEFIDRRDERRRLLRLEEELEGSGSPEGVETALCDLRSRIFEAETGLRQVRRELTGLGLSILRQNPLTIHIPGKTRSGELVFCWQEGEEQVCHGHAIGEEEEPRRPLRVRSKSAS